MIHIGIKQKYKKYTSRIFTWSIIAILIIVYSIELFFDVNNDINKLLDFGCMNNIAVVTKLQFWRLFTAQFIHAGFFHIICNIVMIYFFGMFLEQFLGHIRYLTIYLLSGVGGNLLSFALGQDNVISCGASTAVFGLMGSVLALYFLNNDNIIAIIIGRQAFLLLICNIVVDFFMPSVDIIGHIGGTITGFLLTIILGSIFFKDAPSKIRVLFCAIFIIYLVYCLRQGMVINI
ncbi:rhomboid family intramembrane serine protease [Lactobacillus iners]|uniref:rhomboid family intramembrane serine protease n=1 Tax=Lactobacillus iners TaxID=147802 RepID=UPI0029C23B32|nr:rhomboid family intramembrane serine protease [Lactobacillus iners]MDX5069933.1 rhomboid family intramembrane serine protease [Lactobacillus iners]MDX5083835.1 rhomboid family intramembrane serine protease [Lactobacillus iners]MDX5095403.1 rhomboid family intramembrane serine protease [Lactobacillus iners]